MIVTEAMLAELRGQGAVAARPFVPIGEVRTGVAARLGEAVPPIDSADALKAALLAAPTIYLPDTVQSTAGKHVADVLARLGIAAETAPPLRASQRRHSNARLAERARRARSAAPR
jgi:molybdate transport system substrate-binding protein